MAGEDPNYIAWLATQPCALAQWCGARSGPPHHARHDEHGPIGVGKRAHDHRAIPLCAQHHDDFHDGRGLFGEMNREERRHWMDFEIRRWRGAYNRTPPVEVPF